MDNASTEVSLTSHSVTVKEREEHLPVILFTKDKIDADKPFQW